MASKEVAGKDTVARLFEQIPHTYVLPFLIIDVAALLTYIMIVVCYLLQPLAYIPGEFSGTLMVIIKTFITFFVPSGSGQAMVTMPIMVPVSAILEIPLQVAVLAFQYGDGLSTMFTPTLGATMAAPGVARVCYG